MQTDVNERAPKARLWSTAALLTLFTMVHAGCGFGTAGLMGTSSSSGTASGQSVASDLIVQRSAMSPAPILFTLTDQEGDSSDVGIRYRKAPETTFRPITLAAGSSLKGVRAGTVHTVGWNFAADLGPGYHEGIEIQLDLEGGISPSVLGGVVQGNDAPVVLAAGPSAPQPEYGGNTDLAFMVKDSAADTVRVMVQFDAGAGWQLARPAATVSGQPTPEFAVLGVSTTADGKEATFRWDTNVDLPNFDGDVQLQFTPADQFATGTPFPAQSIRIDNNAPPQAVLNGDEFALGRKDQGRIPVPFQLFDEESDELDFVVQWRALGQSFPPLPTTPAALRDLLTNPQRAAERLEKQIAVESPLAFKGQVGVLSGIASNQVRLPEVASSAAGLLGYDIDGRTLEILRATAIPAAVAWSPNPLSNPVDVLPLADGVTALVLDANGPSGWRVRELKLATGEVLSQFASGGGSPKTLAISQSGTRVFVASNTMLFRFDSEFGTPLGAIAHGFADGARGLAALGTDVVVATGDDKLLRIDFGTTLVVTLLAQLSTPWGVVADPLAEGSIYLAERGANRVVTLDLDNMRSRPLAALAAPGLGALALPRPAALALENHGARLLVMTQPSLPGPASLRTLDLRSPRDLDNPTNGVADPLVREVVQFSEPQAPLARISTGPDRLRAVSLAGVDRLALGGGVRNRFAIIAESQAAGSLPPYSPSTQAVTLTANLTPSERPERGAPWRIQVPLRGKSSPEGRRRLFVWDTTGVRATDRVQIRVLPIDGDVGTSVAGTQFKPFNSSLFRAAPVIAGTISREDAAMADLDGDGDLDLVTTNSNDQLAVHLQTAPGEFSTPIALQTGDNPQHIVAADLNGDGLLDLVSANKDSDDLFVIYQTAPGVFDDNNPRVLNTGLDSEPQGVAAADLNGDGRLDLVSANGLSDRLMVFFQSASGVLPTTANLVLEPGDFPRDVAGADLNGDGLLDIVSANDFAGTLTVFFQGPAPGAFNTTPDRTLPTGGRPLATVAADLDGDGDIDLVSSTAATFELAVFYQTSPGNFTLLDRLPVGGRPESVRAADLDDDGDVDLVVADRYGGNLVLFLQEPATPPLNTPSWARDSAANGTNPYTVAAGDLDGDGDIDLISCRNTITPLYQNRQATFVSPTPLAGEAFEWVTSADLDGDGDTDFAAASSNTLALYFQDAPGIFNPGSATLPMIGGPFTIDSADLDGDGDIDLVANSNSSVRLFFQTEPGVFDPVPTSLPNPLQSGMKSASAADLNNDGLLDIIAGVPNQDILALYLQTAPGVFDGINPIQIMPGVGSGPWSGVTADLNGDGYPDIISVNSGNDSLTLFMQTPAVLPQTLPTFTPAPGQLTTGSGPRFACAAHLNGDDRIDLVAAANGNLSLYFQTATPGVFPATASITLPTSNGTWSILAEDLDGDGDIDLAATNRFSAVINISVFHQVAPGVFVEAAPLLTGPTTNTQCVAAGDLDSDGDIDLVSVDYGTDTLTLFFGGK
ncbi:MAG: hypothetical protein ACJAYX_001553 [Planctomycetota bacterium]|jgi:hypothetical protein